MKRGEHSSAMSDSLGDIKQVVVRSSKIRMMR
jgi:hypothetical protein